MLARNIVNFWRRFYLTGVRFELVKQRLSVLIAKWKCREPGGKTDTWKTLLIIHIKKKNTEHWLLEIGNRKKRDCHTNANSHLSKALNISWNGCEKREHRLPPSCERSFSRTTNFIQNLPFHVCCLAPFYLLSVRIGPLVTAHRSTKQSRPTYRLFPLYLQWWWGRFLLVQWTTAHNDILIL